MTKYSPLIGTLLLFIETAGHSVYGQTKDVTYTYYSEAHYDKTKSKDTIKGLEGFGSFGNKINEITLNPDSTFVFWSRHNVSCFTWHSYKGKWKNNSDTLVFSNFYEVDENDTKVLYKKKSRQEFTLTYKTDKCSSLKNKSIKIQYEYDFDAHLESPEKMFVLDANNSIIIPFKDIPNLDKLAAFKIEYLLNYVDRRYHYLTENKTINIKQGDLPNIINVELLQKPKKEIVYRTIKAVIKNDTLEILSISKTKTFLPDLSRDIEFEDGFRLNK